MTYYILPLLFIALVYAVMIFLNERIGLFGDSFPTPARKAFAYAWLGVFMLLLCLLIVASALAPPSAKDLARVPFYSLFSLHVILLVFLIGWWLLVGRPPLRTFLNIQREHTGEALLTGFAVGVGGWIFTIAIALMIALILQAAGLFPHTPEPSAMIAWMAALPLWKKGLIVLSAMTVEEAFFRGWLQKRVGLIASTALFALAHSGLGQPFLLIGVAIISLVIGTTFYRTKNLIPGIIAHGVFDAVQLFVIIPIAFRLTGIGG
jgi:membrane protease YdiL (CAAX protease family)